MLNSRELNDGRRLDSDTNEERLEIGADEPGVSAGVASLESKGLMSVGGGSILEVVDAL